MLRAISQASIVLALVALAAAPAFANMDDGSTVKIQSPVEGATVSETFELKYDLTKGSKAAHAHVYLDGQPQEEFSGTFKGVKKGKHKIMVEAATHDHEHLAASDTVTVVVR